MPPVKQCPKCSFKLSLCTTINEIVNIIYTLVLLQSNLPSSMATTVQPALDVSLPLFIMYVYSSMLDMYPQSVFLRYLVMLLNSEQDRDYLIFHMKSLPT